MSRSMLLPTLKVGLCYVVVFGSMASGCSGNSSGASLGPEPEATTLAPIKVDLPPPPPFTPSDIPERYADDSLSIRGLRRGREQHLNHEVRVKAYLLEVYQCPVCPKGHTCKLCDRPHFFLGDKPDTKKDKALMVVDYLLPRQRAPILTVGKQYILSGTFAINSPTGFGSSDGLLVFGKMKDDRGQEFVSQAERLEAKALAGEAAEPPKKR